MENLDLKKKVKVWNRSIGTIGYTIDALRVKRTIEPNKHSTEITLEELRELTYIPGGRKLMEKYMLIKDQDVCQFLDLPLDPEYFYDEKDVKVLLTEGTEDQLLDCLEFAPKGVLDLIQKIAVELPLDSAKKRGLISKALGINIDTMIKHNKELQADSHEAATTATKTRRSTPIQTEKKETTSKYTVVNREVK